MNNQPCIRTFCTIGWLSKRKCTSAVHVGCEEESSSEKDVNSAKTKNGK